MTDFLNDGKMKWRFSRDSFWTQRAQATPLGATHGGVAISCDGNIYCSTDGPRSVIVFDHDGNALRQFDARWSGIHSLQIVEQAGEEFLLCAHLTAHRIVMLTMTGKTGDRPQRTLYWKNGSAWAIRDGDLKLVVGNKDQNSAPELFDLAKDRPEKNNLTFERPDDVKRRTAIYQKWAGGCEADPVGSRSRSRK